MNFVENCECSYCDLYRELRYIEAELASARRALNLEARSCVECVRITVEDGGRHDVRAATRKHGPDYLCDDHADGRGRTVSCHAAIREADHAERERNGR